MSRCNKSSLDTRNEIYRQNNSHENLKIYNIFTRFFTGPKQWLEVAIKAKNMLAIDKINSVSDSAFCPLLIFFLGALGLKSSSMLTDSALFSIKRCTELGISLFSSHSIRVSTLVPTL